MFKKLSLLLGLVAALPASSFAWVGGPFDGGDYSQLLDDRGIYQTAFRFRNGSGFSQFGVNVDLGPSVSAGGAGGSSTASSSSTVGSSLNRSVIYYKGLTFFGNATGMVDHDKRQVIGFTNAQSEVTLSEQTSTSTSGDFFFFGSSNQVNASENVVNNGGRGFVANINWQAKITSTHPETRYEGEGELTVLNPDVQPIISGLAQEIASGIISVNVGDDDTIIISDPFGFLTDPEFLAAITPKNLDQVRKSSETIKIKVYGQRKFFLSER